MHVNYIFDGIIEKARKIPGSGPCLSEVFSSFDNVTGLSNINFLSRLR